MIPTVNVRAEIAKLADEHGVRYVKTIGDTWANVVTRLSDDEVVLDATEELIIALNRAGVISSQDAVFWHVNYLREKLNL